MDELFEKHDKVVLAFSGGADSVALLEYTKKYHDRIKVIYCDAGAAFPHVKDFVVESLEKYQVDYEIIRREIDVQQFFRRVGYPADIVPTSQSPIMRMAARDKDSLRLVPWTSCCNYNIWNPLWEYCSKNGYTLLLRGTKHSDKNRGVDSYYEYEGIEVFNPIEAWSDEKVFSYLKEHNIRLPEQYEFFKDSLDCICCTAPLFGGYDKAKARLAFIKKYYPLQYESLIKSIDEIYIAALGEINDLGRLLEEAGNGTV